MNYLTADFGSTFTKLTAINSNESCIVGTAHSFTTIESDITHGFRTALHALEQRIGRFEYDQLLCCSSAGGGLKMVALGLVPELTAKAAKLAASSAGAKVIKTYSFEISQAEQDEIYRIHPDLVLLCGGTDGGNKEVIIANAKRLSAIRRDFSIIVAGNKNAVDDVEEILSSSGKDYVIAPNVMPQFNKLQIEPAKKCIRDLFIRKIIDAKGLSGIQQMSHSEIIPTPLAVMAACELLCKGTGTTSGIGELIAVDLGGATTDIYSMTDGVPSIQAMTKGLPEPFSKRSVEGDLGMRYSLPSLVEEMGIRALEEQTGLATPDIQAWIDQCIGHPDSLAETDSKELLIEEALAKGAVELAMERHCGYLERSYTPMGELFSITGKDLSEVPYIIGIGGAIINSVHPAKILEGALFNPRKINYMKPKHPQYLLDEKYIFASMGLLSTLHPELALRIMKEEIRPIKQ